MDQKLNMNMENNDMMEVKEYDVSAQMRTRNGRRSRGRWHISD